MRVGHYHRPRPAEHTSRRRRMRLTRCLTPKGSPSGIRTEATSRSRLRAGGTTEDARESPAIVSRCKRCAREDPRRLVLRASVHPRLLVRRELPGRVWWSAPFSAGYICMKGSGYFPHVMKRACKPCSGAITKHCARNHRKLCSRRLEARHAFSSKGGVDSLLV